MKAKEDSQSGGTMSSYGGGHGERSQQSSMYEVEVDNKANNYEGDVGSHDANRMYKINHFVIPIFIMETIVLGCLALLAYYMRFTDAFPLHQQGFYCDDQKLRYPHLQKTSLLDIPPEMFYPICFLLPVVVIILGEIGFWMFSSKPKKVIRAHCVQFKIHQMPRRMIRFIGVLFVGLLMTSIFTDAMKLLSGSLRPYFLTVCKPAKTNCTEFIVSSDVCTGDQSSVREARLSFPSLYAAVSASAAVYTATYVHNLLQIRGAHLLRPVIVFTFLGLSLIAGFSRIALYRNHWVDVFTGFALGAAISIYLGVFTLNSFQEIVPAPPKKQEDKNMELNSPFFQWFRLPRVSFKVKDQKFGNAVFANGNAEVPPKPSTTSEGRGIQDPAFRKDLTRTVENLRKNARMPSDF